MPQRRGARQIKSIVSITETVLDNRPYLRYISQIKARPSKGHRPVTADRWGGRGSRMGLVTFIRAVLGIDRPARDRTARCWLHWCRRGSSRLHPVIPGSAARSRVRGIKPSAHDRGGAPKGERAASLLVPRQCGAGGEHSARRIRWQAYLSAAERNPWCAFRRSASLLLREARRAFLPWRGQSSGAKARRENEEEFIRPRDSGGGGPPVARGASVGWWRGPLKWSFVVGAEGV